MPAALDLTGQRFGELIALQRVDNSVMKRAWRCKCSCGEIKNVRTDALKRGKTKSCGIVGRHHQTVADAPPFYGPVMPLELAKEKQLKWYVTGHPCKHGHVCERQLVNGVCRQCGAERNAANCKQWYKNKGFERVCAYAKQWAEDNPEKRKEVANRYARKITADPVANARKNKMRREGNRSQLHAIRYQQDKNYRLLINLKARVQQALKLQCGHKAHKTAELLGCSLKAFKAHIAGQFSDGMSWNNHGYATWHLDHIRPCASFDLTDPAQQLICFNWANHQPLLAVENMSKNDEWTPAMEAKWAQMMRDHGYRGDLFLQFPVVMAA